MDSITLVLALSSIVWLIVDRLKPMWTNLVYGKYITTIVAGLLGAAGVFSFNLDLICALKVVSEVTIGAAASKK